MIHPLYLKPTWERGLRKRHFEELKVKPFINFWLLKLIRVSFFFSFPQRGGRLRSSSGVFPSGGVRNVYKNGSARSSFGEELMDSQTNISTRVSVLCALNMDSISVKLNKRIDLYDGRCTDARRSRRELLKKHIKYIKFFVF